jgi:hypothetical protein
VKNSFKKNKKYASKGSGWSTRRTPSSQSSPETTPGATAAVPEPLNGSHGASGTAAAPAVVDRSWNRSNQACRGVGG